MIYVVNEPIGTLYSKPEDKTEIADEILYGMDCEIISQDNDFYRIRTFYGYEGYIKCGSIIPKPELCGEERTVVKPFCDVLTMPKVQGWNVITLPRGAYIYCGEENQNGYVKANLNDGRTGYIRSDATVKRKVGYDLNDEEALRDALVKSAEAYLGVQYRWGGKTPAGIDCSGLCSMAYMLNGIIIYRDAKLIEGFPLTEISLDNVKKGDLLFAPGHVMMYIGSGNIIHSTSLNGGVVYAKMPEAKNITAVGSIFTKQ